MKIVFWSNCPKSGVTSNMTAVGVMLSMLYPARFMMMTNHCNHKNLGRVLLGYSYEEVVKETPGYYIREGKKPVIKRLASLPGSLDFLEEAQNPHENGLYYYTQGKQFSNEVYELRVMDEINQFFEYINQYEEYILIDAKSQDSVSTMQLLEEADLVVVNLKQEESLIRNFFRRYGSIAGKCVYIISGYKRRGNYLRTRLIREYCIHPDRVAVIPFHPVFSTMIEDGRITSYIMEHCNCKRTAKEYRYIWNVKKAAKMIMTIAENLPVLEMEELYEHA